MATPSSVVRKRKGLDELRHEILSYKPGKAVPCDDERVVFSDTLVIATMNLPMFPNRIVPALRSALYGDVEPLKLADERQTFTEDQEEHLTDSIYVIIKSGLVSDENVRDLAGKVGCIVLSLHPSHFDYYQEWIKTIKKITGHVPICAMETTGQSEVIEKSKNKLKQLGVTDIYDIAPVDGDLSDETRLQWLDLLHGCLKKGDEGISADLIQLYSLPSFERLWNQVKEAQTRHGEEIKEGEEAKKLLQGRITDLEQELNESRASRASIVSENGRLQGTMKVEQERREHSERAMMENEKRATQIMETYKQREMESEKKLVSKLLREDTLTKTLEEKERNETTLRQQVEELKKGGEGDRARFEKEKRSIELSWKKEHDYKEGLLEQLKRENWKLRTEIQLESEIRSAEQKKKAEIHQLGFIPWVASGKQAQSRTSSFEDNSTGGLGRSNTVQAGNNLETDRKLDKLSKYLPHGTYTTLCTYLGIGYTEADSFLAKFNMDYQRATRHCLAQWKTRTGGNMDELETFLKDAEVEGLVKYIK